LRPVLIRKFDKFQAKQADEFFNVVLEEGMRLEEAYERAGKKGAYVPPHSINDPKGASFDSKYKTKKKRLY